MCFENYFVNFSFEALEKFLIRFVSCLNTFFPYSLNEQKKLLFFLGFSNFLSFFLCLSFNWFAPYDPKLIVVNSGFGRTSKLVSDHETWNFLLDFRSVHAVADNPVRVYEFITSRRANGEHGKRQYLLRHI